MPAQTGQEAPAGPRAGGVWEDTFDDFSKTNYTGKGLYISGGNVTVGPDYFQFEADKPTVLLYHFDDGSGTTAKDSGPNRLDQTLTNMDSATDWVAGLSGTALDFDGLNDYTVAPASPVYSQVNISVEAWINQRRTIGPYQDMTLTYKRSGYFLSDHDFTIDTSNGVVYARNNNNPLFVWTYVAGTFDGTAVKFYRNGALLASKNSTYPMDHDTNIFQIGADGIIATDAFDGLIDELRVSHSARSAKEINDTYLQYKYVEEGNLVRTTSLISKKITVPAGNYWDRFNAVQGIPPGTRLNYSVLDGLTGLPVPGFENLTDTDIDLSGVNPIAHPTINLRANFNTNYKLSPLLDRWNVSWKPNSRPEVANLTIADRVMRTASVPLTVIAFDANQKNSSLRFTVESRYRDDTTWTAALFRNITFTSERWTAVFAPGGSAKLGPYHLRITLTDEMNASCIKDQDSATFVFTEKALSADIPQKGIGIYRGESQAIALDIKMEGALDEMAVNVTLYDYAGAECPWLDAPMISGGVWTQNVEPPLNATVGECRARINITNNYFQQIDTMIPGAVNILNNPPSWKSNKSVTINEDTLGIIQLADRLSDADDPASELTLKLIRTDESGHAVLSTSGTSLKVTFLSPDWSGTIPLRISVSDRYDSAETDLDLVVSQVPDAPRIADIPDIIASEDTALDYTFSASDPDPDSQIYYTADLGDLKRQIEYFKGYSFDILSGRLILPLSNDMVGEYACVLTVSDGTFNSTMPFKLVVLNVNDPPFWVNVPANSTTIAGTEYFFDVNALDIDVGDSLEYSITSVPTANISIDKTTGIIRWGPGLPRNYTMTVSVSDRNTTILHSFRLEVLRANHPPKLARFSPDQNRVSIELGKTADFKVEPKDEDGDILEYRWSIDGYSKNGDKNFEFKPVATGSYVIRVDISDGRSSVGQEWNITVNEPSNQFLASTIWTIPVIAIIIIGVAAAVVVSRRGRKRARTGTPAPEAADFRPEKEESPSMTTDPDMKLRIIGSIDADDLDEPEADLEEESPAEAAKLTERSELAKEGGPERSLAGPTPEGMNAVPPPEPIRDEMLGNLKPLPNPFRSESQALRTLSSLPRGMPATLNKYGIDGLAEMLTRAQFYETVDEDIVVRIGGRLYNGDITAMATFLQHFKK